MLYDLVIVGGSFAGLSCARTAALRGLKVAVIDSKPEPGARIRTTGILVKEATDDCDLPSALMRKIRGVRLYAPDDRTLDLSAPNYFFHATDTAGLMRWMAVEAELAGAVLLYGHRFEGADETADGLVLAGLGIQTRFLVGADGARSRVAMHFGLGLNKRFLAGLEIECDPIPSLDPRFLHCFADNEMAPGYIGWVVPGAGVTQIGVAATRGKKPELAALIERARRIWGVNRLEVVERRSGLIPCGGPVSRIGKGRVMLIGDAAGLVSPVTGGGIHTALHFGRRAAQLISDYLLDRGPRPLSVFEREIPRYRLKRAMRRVFDLAPPNALINATLMTSPMRALAQRLYFHRRGGDPASFAAWSDTFGKDEITPLPPNTPPPELHCI
ncbi:MAG TPA: NAD(P)/FAD-dependent oxidoreductase [Rhizomicrobium sp.]|nr:NAD(P)/FAD-dependent oxidoreductase [Rhizomicrobium sp.]